MFQIKYFLYPHRILNKHQWTVFSCHFRFNRIFYVPRPSVSFIKQLFQIFRLKRIKYLIYLLFISDLSRFPTLRSSPFLSWRFFSRQDQPWTSWNALLTPQKYRMIEGRRTSHRIGGRAWPIDLISSFVSRKSSPFLKRGSNYVAQPFS